MEELDDLRTAISELKLHDKDEFMLMNMIDQVEDAVKRDNNTDDDMLSQL